MRIFICTCLSVCPPESGSTFVFGASGWAQISDQLCVNKWEANCSNIRTRVSIYAGCLLHVRPFMRPSWPQPWWSVRLRSLPGALPASRVIVLRSSTRCWSGARVASQPERLSLGAPSEIFIRTLPHRRWSHRLEYDFFNMISVILFYW